MNTIVKQYKLEKILSPRPGRPGFATPLFRNEDSGEIFVQEIENDIITKFTVISFTSINGFLQDGGDGVCTVGGDAYYAFIEPSDEVIVGSKEKVSDALIGLFGELNAYPFLRTQIAKFINNQELLNFASATSDRMISSNKKVLGVNDKFEVYQDKRGEYRWRRTARNGQIVGASCEGYKSIAEVRGNMFRGPKESDKWEFYEDKSGEHRWRRTASNGQIVGASSEGYKAKADALGNAERQGFRE